MNKWVGGMSLGKPRAAALISQMFYFELGPALKGPSNQLRFARKLSGSSGLGFNM
jgi:hypothetical protein